MKKLRKILAMILVVCMTFGCMQTDASAQSSLNENQGFSVEQNLVKQEEETEVCMTTEEESTTTTGDSVDVEVEPEVTRVEWLQALTTAFGFSVKENNYADNYFSDINSESEYYYVVMLATEFGLIDVEAGEAFKPEEAATREFVAHSMNMCTGIQLEENEDGEITYTFDEAKSVTYPDDIQVAIEQSWFALDGLNFLPEKAVTQEEADALMEIAEAEVASRVIDENHEDTYSFAEGVVVLNEALEIELTEDDEYTIYGTPEIATGDRIGFVIDEIPFVKKVVSLKVNEEKTVVQTETVDLEEAFTEFDIEGSSDADLTEVVATCDDVDMFYIVDGTEDAYYEDGVSVDILPDDEQVNAIRLVKTYEIPSEVQEKFNLAEGVDAYIEAVVYNTSEDHKLDMNGESHIAINATVRFTCNVSMDVLKAIGVGDSIELANVRIGGIGKLKIALELQLEGDISVNLVENLRFGVKFSKAQGLSTISSMQKESFSVVAKVEAKAGVKASIGVDLILIEGYLYARVGMQGKIELSAYPDTADVCLQANAWLYAAVGYDVEVFWSKSWNGEISIFNEKNSPVRISFHYDNGVPVNECAKKGCVTTTGKVQAGVKYYTPANSCYGYNGASWGYDSAGKEYTIFKYNVIDGTNNICITTYNGNVSALTIPSTLDGYTVTQIGDCVFDDRKELISVTIPNTVTSIGFRAFGICTNLSYLKLPDNKDFTHISSSICFGCKNLRNIDIPDTITVIGDCAFYDCSGLEKVTLSKNLVGMAGRAFENCDGLTEIEIPKSLDWCGVYYDNSYYGVYDGPFVNCSNLKNVYFEVGTTQIADNLFAGCDGIEEITIPDTVTVIEDSAFRNCENLKNVTILDSVTEIGTCVFYNCSGLEKVTLSKNLVSMGGHAFENCDGLTEIEIPKSLDWCGVYDGPFANCSNLKNVYFEVGTTQIADDLFAGCDGIEEITIPDTVTVIEYGAFRNCENLKNVTIPDSVTEVGENVFYNCSKLEKVVIPDSVTEIGDYAFYSCSGLAKVTLSKNLVSMGGCAFEFCDGLTEIEIPKSLDWCGVYDNSYYGVYDGPFANCINLKNVYFEVGTTQIADNLFAGCDGIEEIIMPDTVTAIRSNAFYNCDALENITIPENVEIIESQTFYDCDALKSITIPSKVATIGNYAFYGSGALSTVTLPNRLTSLGNYAFKGCELLTDIHFGTGLKSIGTETFMDCVSLQKIVLPYSIESIGSNAFKNDTKLTEIYIPERTTSIDSTAFSYPDKITIYGAEGSYAETFAKENEITFIADTTTPTAVTLSLSAETVKLETGETFELKADITPETAAERKLIYVSSDKNVATVDENGKITAVANGTATITVKMEDGLLEKTCTVTVADKICLDKETVTTQIGEALKLNVTLAEEVTGITWISTNTSVAEVSQDGTVIIKTEGQTTIIVTSTDGKYRAECVITVGVPQPAYTLGDVNADGNIDANDALVVLKSVAKMTTLTETQSLAADVNKDASIDANDALLILKYVAKMISSFE